MDRLPFNNRISCVKVANFSIKGIDTISSMISVIIGSDYYNSSSNELAAKIVSDELKIIEEGLDYFEQLKLDIVRIFGESTSIIDGIEIKEAIIFSKNNFSLITIIVNNDEEKKKKLLLFIHAVNLCRKYRGIVIDFPHSISNSIGLGLPNISNIETIREIEKKLYKLLIEYSKIFHFTSLNDHLIEKRNHLFGA